MKFLLAAICLIASMSATAQPVTLDALKRTHAAIGMEISRLADERSSVLREGRKRASAQRGTIQMQPFALFRDDFGREEAAHLDERIRQLQADRRLIMDAMRAIVAAN